jgi:hypothetical protein
MLLATTSAVHLWHVSQFEWETIVVNTRTEWSHAALS